MTLAIVQAPYIPRITGYGVTDFEKGKLAAANVHQALKKDKDYINPFRNHNRIC